MRPMTTSWSGELELEEESDGDGVHSPKHNVGPFEVDHLATFAIPHQPSGRKLIEDGFNKLFEMERTSGVWTMQCSLHVSPPFFHVVFLENGRKSRSERYRVDDMVEPTARLSDDRRDPFNNVFLFVYRSTSSTTTTPSQGRRSIDDNRESSKPEVGEEMHLFQCVNCSAKDIVDGVKEAKSDLIKAGFKKNRANVLAGSSRADVEVESAILERRSSTPQQPHNNVHRAAKSVSPPPASPRDLNGGGGGMDDADARLHRQYSVAERVHHDVLLLNRCFDDVELFVGKLQLAAEAYKELEAKQKKKKSGFAKSGKKEKDLMASLYLKARPPPEHEFVEIFKKFKLCFNLLSKLKPHIHEPNAPELVHFLFTPMSLVVEASKDAVSGLPELAAKIVTPLLLKETIDLLSNCLTSREHQLWLTLGDAWVVPKAHWKGYAPPYMPAFTDGWRPNPMLYYDEEDRIKTLSSHLSSSAMEVARLSQSSNHLQGGFRGSVDRPSSDGFSHEAETERPSSSKNGGGIPKSLLDSSSPIYESSNIYRGGPRRAIGSGGSDSPLQNASITSSSRNGGFSPTSSSSSIRGGVVVEPPTRKSTPITRREELEADIDHQLSSLTFEELRHDSRLLRAFANRMQTFEEHLLHRGSRIFEAVFDRRSNHVKELTVRKSEVLEVIDDAKQWWKVRNWRGEEGFAPNTILKLVQDSGLSSSSSEIRSGIPPPPPPPLPPPAVRESLNNNNNGAPIGSVGHAAAVLAARGQLRSIQATGAATKNLRSPPKRESLSNALNDELKLRMSHGRGPAQPPSLDISSELHKGGSTTIYLSQDSTEDEVQKWLEIKGFSPRVQQALQGQTGLSIFTLKQNEFIEFFGKEEGTRLDSQLTVQKNLCGYSTISSYELRAILNHRKSQVEKAASVGGVKSAASLDETSGLEAPPDFDPPTPQPSVDGGSLASGQFAL